MRRRNKKKNFIMLLLLLVVTLGIGYALISTNLTINGIGKFNNQNWNVHFEDLTYNPGNVTLSQNDVAASINQSTMTDIAFTVTLQKPGDFYEFEVAAVNSGSMDAMVGLITNNLDGNPIGTGNEVPAYARYTATYSDGVEIEPNHLLKAGYSETYKVRLEYRTDIDPEDLPDEVEELLFTFGVQYVQADSNARMKGLPTHVIIDVSNIDVGDILAVTCNVDDENYNRFADAEGTCTIKVDNNEYTENISGGRALFNIEDYYYEGAGQHSIFATYSGDSKYASSSGSADFVVGKIEPDFGLNIVSDEYVLIIDFTVPKDLQEDVTISVNNTDYTETYSNGKGQLVIENCPIGHYHVVISYSGDSKYLPGSYSKDYDLTID